MKAAPWILIAVLGIGFAGNAKAESESVAATVAHDAFIVGGTALAGCYVSGPFGKGDGMKACAIGAAVAGSVAAAVVANNAMAADAPAEADLNQQDSE